MRPSTHSIHLSSAFNRELNRWKKNFQPLKANTYFMFSIYLCRCIGLFPSFHQIELIYGLASSCKHTKPYNTIQHTIQSTHCFGFAAIFSLFVLCIIFFLTILLFTAYITNSCMIITHFASLFSLPLSLARLSSCFCSIYFSLWNRKKTPKQIQQLKITKLKFVLWLLPIADV